MQARGPPERRARWAQVKAATWKPANLNAQYINVLEDLGVPHSAFESLATQQLDRMRKYRESRESAINSLTMVWTTLTIA